LINGFIHLAAGLGKSVVTPINLAYVPIACGLTGLSAGYAIGIVGDYVSTITLHKQTQNAHVEQMLRSYVYEAKTLTVMVLVLIFA
jgi:hypothetical protein